MKCLCAISAFEHRAHYLFLRTAPSEMFQEMSKAVKALEDRISKKSETEIGNADA